MASLRVSKTSFLVDTRTLALSTGASVSDIRGLENYSSERSEVSTRTRSRFVWLLCEFLKHRSW